MTAECVRKKGVLEKMQKQLSQIRGLVSRNRTGRDVSRRMRLPFVIVMYRTVEDGHLNTWIRVQREGSKVQVISKNELHLVFDLDVVEMIGSHLGK